jgi:hypothetical protein
MPTATTIARARLDKESRLTTRQDQLGRFTLDLGVRIEGLKPEEIEAVFWRQLEARATAFLRIVDDVPSGITASDLERNWFARGANASTLITTRSPNTADWASSSTWVCCRQRKQ